MTEFASVTTGNDSNSSLNASAASNIAAAAVNPNGGAQISGYGQLISPEDDAANAFTSLGSLSVSPSQTLPPPPPYELALSMPLSPRRYGQSVVTNDIPSIDRNDTVHVSPSSPPRYKSWAPSSPGARTKTTMTTSPLGTGATGAATGAAGAGAAAGAAEGVLLGSPPPPPYEMIFSPVVDKISTAEQAETPGGDSAVPSVILEGLHQG